METILKEEQEILKLNSPYRSWRYCYYFYEIANIKAHEKIILNSKNIHFCYHFAKDIKHANRQLLSEVVLASGNLEYINLFYENVDFDKTKYNNLLFFV